MNKEVVLPESLVRTSYIEQGQLSQAHRWLSACLIGPTAYLVDDLLARDANLILDQYLLSTGEFGLLKLSVADVEAADTSLSVTERQLTLRCDRFGFSDSYRAARIDFHFDAGGDVMPRIRRVEITTTEAKADVSRAVEHPAAASRILALKHRWHALVEKPDKDPEPFREIIASQFRMDWGQGSISSFAELSAWVTGSAASVSAARHDISHYEWRPLDVNRFEAIFEFNWSGLSAEGQPMQAKSRHTWLVNDSEVERFARIEQMQIEFLVPFHLVTDAVTPV